MRKSSSLVLLALSGLLAGCISADWPGTHTVRGSGNVISETRAVSQFDRVSLFGSGHLTIIQGDQESLTIEADDNLLPLIKSGISGGLLKIGPENVNLHPTKTIQYRLQLKNLREVQLAGALEAEAQSLKTDRLLLAITGSGKIQVPKLDTGELEVSISGSGDILLAGKAGRQRIQISGSGDYQAGDCGSQDTTVSVSGSGNATVWVQRTLEAHISGSGDIRYYGSPQVNSLNVAGSGSVHSLGNK